MASNQLRRRENTTSEREMDVEKDRVPKMATHFESLSLAGKQAATSSDQVVGFDYEKAMPRQAVVQEPAVGFDYEKAREPPRLDQEEAAVPVKVGAVNVSATILATPQKEAAADDHKKQINNPNPKAKAKAKGQESQHPSAAAAAQPKTTSSTPDFHHHHHQGIATGREKDAENYQLLQGRERETEFPHAIGIGKFQVNAAEAEGDKRGQNESPHHQEMKESSRRKQQVSSSPEEKDKYLAGTGGRSEEKPGGGRDQQQLSLEEISKLRGTAQQNAAETIRSAEQRYNYSKAAAAKESSANQDQGQSTVAAADYGVLQAKDTVVEGAKKTSKYLAEKGSETAETIVEGAKRTSQYLAEKGSGTAGTAAEKIQQGYAATKDTLVGAGKTALDYTVPKAEQAKDYAVDATKNIAVATKDTTIETGKEAAEIAAKVATAVKDRAVAAGWSATHFTTEKTVEGTKAAVRAVDKVAEYAGHKAREIAAMPLGAAAAAGESTVEYTARKKEEAERELEAKRSAAAKPQESGQDVENSRSRGKQQSEMDGEKSLISGRQKERQTTEQQQGMAKSLDATTDQRTWSESDVGAPGLKLEERQGQGAGVLGAIGETIVEIAQTTKELIIGPDQPQNDQSGGFGGNIDDAHGQGQFQR